MAINNKKCVGKIFYEKGGTTQERMVEFLETQIFPKYKDHLIILDNAKSHNNQMVKDAITKSGNKYLKSCVFIAFRKTKVLVALSGLAASQLASQPPANSQPQANSASFRNKEMCFPKRRKSNQKMQRNQFLL